MRVVGIDPGTGSFDFFGMDDEKIILDTTIPVPVVDKNPLVLLDTLRTAFPLDMIVGPSGHGIAVKSVRDITESDMHFITPDDKSVPLYDGIRLVIRLMKKEGWPLWFTPAVVHLPTVPLHRKANKLDMGTADKVCCAAMAIRDQAERLGINYDKTSFILVEIGYAFTAVLGVEGGKIVDGIGGTSGGPGFISLGCMDAELPARMGAFPGTLLFTGGARDASGKDDLTPEEMAREPGKYAVSWNMMIESILKSVAAMMVSVEKPREIIISGRLARIPEIELALKTRLSRFGDVHSLQRRAKVAKEAAEGAYILGEGLLGGKYKGIVDVLQLRSAGGTMYDYIWVKGAKVKQP